MLIHLLSTLGRYGYVTALECGATAHVDGKVEASAVVAQSWETLEVCDLTGKPIDERPVPSGAPVTLRAMNRSFLQPDWGSGTLFTTNISSLQSAHFLIWKVPGSGGEEIRSTDEVAFSSPGKLPTGALPAPQFPPPAIPTEWKWLTVGASPTNSLITSRQASGPGRAGTFKLFKVPRLIDIFLTGTTLYPGRQTTARGTVVIDRRAHPGGVRVFLEGAAETEYGGTPTNVSARLDRGSVDIPEGEISKSFGVILSGHPLRCGAGVQYTVTARQSALRPWTFGTFKASFGVEFVKFFDITPLGTLETNRDGAIIVQLRPDAPLPEVPPDAPREQRDYRITLTAPEEKMRVKTVAGTVTHRAGHAQSIVFTVEPRDRSNICVTAILERLDGGSPQRIVCGLICVSVCGAPSQTPDKPSSRTRSGIPCSTTGISNTSRRLIRRDFGRRGG